MMKKPIKEIAVAVLLGIACGAVSQAFAASRAVGFLHALDTDHDGTIDLNESRTAAATAFDRLDRDHDGTLDGRELRGRLSAGELAAEDADHDGSLTKDEFTGAVEKRFNAANRDSDGTLDARELISRPGRAFVRLVR